MLHVLHPLFRWVAIQAGSLVTDVAIATPTETAQPPTSHLVRPYLLAVDALAHITLKELSYLEAIRIGDYPLSSPTRKGVLEKDRH